MIKNLISRMVASLIVVSVFTALSAEKPNVIIILADDMGSDSISAFNDKLGFKTPRIDALAKESIVFSDGHSGSAVCTPTRYGLLTGRYSWRSRLKRGIVPKWDAPLIEEGRMTIASMLRENGYVTACIGKWHLGWEWPFESGDEVPVGNGRALGELAKKGIDWKAPVTGGPVERGFDYHFGDGTINWPPFVYIENDRLLGTPNPELDYHDPSTEWAEDKVLPMITSNAVSYIEEQAKSEKPFFLYFPMTAPHAPIAPADEFKGVSGISTYIDFAIETDHRVGQIIDAVNRSGIADNTIIVFSADNGTSLNKVEKEAFTKGVSFNTNVRGGKADIWEGGHKVPYMVRWPSKVKAGLVNDTPVCLTDLMATIADVVGIQLPDNAAEDSLSLLPALLGKEFERGAILNHSIQGKFAIRSGNWKLIFAPGSAGWGSPKDDEARKMNLPELQLYNLGDDPKETRNLVAENPELVQTLTKQLHKIILNGRSTAGAVQANVGETWLPEI